MQQLKLSVKAFPTGSEHSDESVEIGDLRFSSRTDLRVWVDDNLKKFKLSIRSLLRYL